MSMLSWYNVTAAEFHAGTKTEDSIYFLRDTKEIYKGSSLFSQASEFFTPTEAEPMPIIKASNRLYINSTNLEGSIWDGTSWKVILQSLGDATESNTAKPVSGKTVVDYVSAVLLDFSKSTEIIKSITWDHTNSILSYTRGDDTTNTVLFDGLAVDLDYDSTTGNLRLLDVSGNAVGSAIKLDLERFVTSAEYDAENKSIILYFDAAKTDKLVIPVEDLVDIYTAESSSTVNLTVTNNKFKAEVKISSEVGNSLSAKADGLFVPPTDISTKIDKVTDAVSDDIALFGADGTLVDSGITINDLKNKKANVYHGATLEEAITGVVATDGDIAIIKVLISADKYEYTAYIYAANTWAAMDGNYNAENVYFGKDLVTTAAIGNITLSNGQATIPAIGKNIKQVWDSIFVKETNPTVTQPAVNVNMSQAKSYEVGTTVTPGYTSNLNAGSYQYGPATGVTASTWSITDTDSHNATSNTGSFDAFVVEDNTNYKITAVATYVDGNIPVTNVGNPYTVGQIKAGSKTGNSGAITGFRCGFYGTLTSKTGTIDSALIRSLTSKTSATPAQGNNWSLNVPVGALRVVFAYPATVRDVNSVLDVNGLNAEIKSAFTMSTINVEGVGGYTTKPYKVYVMDYAAPNDKANTYTIKL